MACRLCTPSKDLVYNLSDLYKPTLDPGLLVTPGGALNGGPAATEDPNGARAPRILQFNISLQHEIRRDLVVEAAYVGNRGVWLTQPNLVSPNGLTKARLASFVSIRSTTPPTGRC